MSTLVSVARFARLLSPFVVVVAALAVLPAGTGGCSGSSSATCQNNQSQSYTDACNAISAAIGGKCNGQAADCTASIADKCKAANQICSVDLNTFVQKINVAATCDDALKVTSVITCVVQ